MPPPLLVVDDNQANLQSMRALLSSLPAELVLVQSGEDALRELLVRDFAAILLDVQMPNLDGHETAALIRSRDRTRHTPIIFVTAFEHPNDAVLRAYALGAVDFLFKPVQSEVLLSKVRVFLELYSQRAELSRQAQLLRDAQEREHQRALNEQRLEFERKLLQEEASRERRLTEALSGQATELARIAREREELVTQLNERDRRKNEFLAVLAHELRNPLVPISNALELFARRAPLDQDEVLGRAVEAAHRQAGHMTRLVDDLLDVSRITRGKVELRREPVRLGSLIEQAVHATEPLIHQRGHRLELRVCEDELLLDADPTRLTQVIGNLLQNAAKYTDPGGQLRLWVRRANDGVEISVQDSGIGIRPEMLDSVFDLFIQEEPGSERAQGGLGLGLTLVKTLVTMHGGSVSAQSEGRGRGSTFTVWLPVADESRAGAGLEALAPPRRLTSSRPLHIVLVEDNHDIRTTTRDLLECLGHQVEEAGDGKTGYELILSRKPQLALMDIGLPDGDGYSVANRIRQVAPDIPTRLVALTGYNAPAEDEAAARPFDAHLVKPVTTDRLVRLFEDLFSSSQASL